MKLDTNTMISVSEAEQNFSKALCLAEENGQVVIHENNRPRYVLIDLENTPYFEMTEDERIEAVARRILNRFRPAFEELAK